MVARRAGRGAAELGRIDEAEARLDAWESSARRLSRAWSLAEAARCRGLIASARGDADGAIALLEHAVEVADGFGRGRAARARGRPAAGSAEAACPRGD